MRRQRLTATILCWLTAFLVAVGAASIAQAHGNPAIAVSPSPADPGATIAVDGSEFEADDVVSLVLEGVGGDIVLGSVTTDAEGMFHFEVALPDTAAPGSYRIKAKASDASAVADFRISQGAGAAPAAQHETSVGFHRETSIGLVIGLASLAGVLALIGVGLLLIRDRPRAHVGEN